MILKLIQKLGGRKSANGMVVKLGILALAAAVGLGYIPAAVAIAAIGGLVAESVGTNYTIAKEDLGKHEVKVAEQEVRGIIEEGHNAAEAAKAKK